MIIAPDLIRLLRRTYALDWCGLHGCSHWARVRVNGLLLARLNGANPRVVSYFAFLHDACRHDDGHDPLHGPRAAEFARSIRNTHIHLDAPEFDHLLQAVEAHTGGAKPGNVTIATCWDADRLDIGRVGVRPDPDRLFTQAAREPRMLAWAYGKSRQWLDYTFTQRGRKNIERLMW